MKFENNIKNIRKERGYTQEQLADICDLKVLLISRIERGENMPRADSLIKIAKGLRCKLDDLVNTKNDINKFSNKDEDMEIEDLMNEVKKFKKNKKEIVIEFLESIIMKNNYDGWKLKKKT